MGKSWKVSRITTQRPTLLTYDQAWEIASQCYEAIHSTFLKTTHLNKCSLNTKPDKLVHDFYNWLQIVFREKSRLPSEVDFTPAANDLNRDISLLVKRTSMEWETASTPDLVNFANQPLSTPQGRLTKFLTFNSYKQRLLNETRNLLVSAIIAKSQYIRKKDCYISSI